MLASMPAHELAQLLCAHVCTAWLAAEHVPSLSLLEQLLALPPVAQTQLTKSVQAELAAEIWLLHLLSTHDPHAALPDCWVNALQVDGVPVEPAEEQAASVAASAPRATDRNQDVIMRVLQSAPHGRQSTMLTASTRHLQGCAFAYAGALGHVPATYSATPYFRRGRSAGSRGEDSATRSKCRRTASARRTVGWETGTNRSRTAARTCIAPRSPRSC